MRSEQALLFALAEMYVQGVSTRKLGKSFDQSMTLIISELVDHDAASKVGINY